ncbi:MAG: superoxide dismutase family protein [Clostridia bacterium]|nr:superoxide dismutase family protein [Clostridia bacterium]
MKEYDGVPDFSELLSHTPMARARVFGSIIYPEIKGDVWFYETDFGILVVVDIEGLPIAKNNCGSSIFALHIHQGESCSGNNNDYFGNVGMHYNPQGCKHPYHAGDLPPILSANGNAFLAVLTNGIGINEIIGRTIIIHSLPDDFVSQPAGNSSVKIACGEIKVY